MVKEFKIKYQGSETSIEVNDNPNAGFCLKITKPPIMRYKAGQALPEIDHEEYLMYLATNLITRAPWPLQNPDAIRHLDKHTFIELCDILGKAFPMEDFLSPVASLTYGKLLEQVASRLQTASTTNAGNKESPSAK